MHPAIQKIADRGIPTSSYVAAIRHLNDSGDLARDQYVSIMSDLVGQKVSVGDDRITKYTFLYLIQETIRKSFNTDVMNMAELLELAHRRAVTFIKENAFVFAEPEDTITVDSDGKPKQKKGAKQEGAATIYQENISKGKATVIGLFMSELDMSKAGATTYFYNMKKQFGG